MGTLYQINCKHCGAHINYTAENDNGYMMRYGANRQLHGHIETETSMRCPSCHRRLNNSLEEFNEQINVAFLRR